MAGTYKCKTCNGNMWPDIGHYREHAHLSPQSMKLKQKLTQGYIGRKGGAATRTNAGKPASSSLAPRRRAYGPF